MTAYVYRAYNADGALLYVGCTVDPASRMRNHYLNTEWWFAAKRFTFEHFDTEADAKAAEVAAIQTEFPRWNVRDRSPFHPDGYRLSRRDIAQLYPEDDRRVTHAHVRRVYEGAWKRARLVGTGVAS